MSMKKLLVSLCLWLAVGLFMTSQAKAHTPLLSVEDNEDGTIWLEGGFSDGSSGAGVKILVVEDKAYQGPKAGKKLYKGKLILKETKMDKNGELTLDKPEGPYLIILDAGPGHVVEKKGPPLQPGEKE